MDPAPGEGSSTPEEAGPSSSSVAVEKAEEPQKQAQPPEGGGQQAVVQEHLQPQPLSQQPPVPAGLSRYESQKRRDWNTFLQYLRNHRPPLTLARCSGANVIEFLKYLDQFGKTKVHADGCAHYGQPSPPAPCPCPLRQAWGSLDALIGRLRAAYEESGHAPESNPFAARAVRIYLREVRDSQAKARGIPYEKKKRKRTQPTPLPAGAAGEGTSSAGGGGGETSGGGTAAAAPATGAPVGGSSGTAAAPAGTSSR